MNYPDDFINKIICGDCLEVMKDIPDASIDMILCDLPYGITAYKWDIPIELSVLWEEYKRIIKYNGVVLLFSTQPFTTVLIQSNIRWFKYDWVWIKTQAANFQLSKKMPLKKHEYVLVFYNKKPTYNPQMWVGNPKMKRIGKNKYQDRKSESYLSSKLVNLENVLSDVYYPTTILDFPSVSRNKSVHPTQKPIDLCEYLIKTYTNENEIILDNCVGSGTTAIACKKTNRNFIGIEIKQEYVDLANKRLLEA